MQRKHLLGTAAAAGLAFGLAAPAQAFDVVNWTLTKTDVMTEIVDIVAYGEFYPTGIVEVEKIQVHIGDLTSTARLDRFENNQASSGGETTLSGSIIFEGPYYDNDDVDNAYTDDIGDEDADQSFGTDLTGDLTTQGTVQLTGDLAGASATVLGGITEDNDAFDGDNVDGGVAFVVDLSDLVVQVDPEETLDARTELPEVNVSATSAANVDSIESEVMTMVHSGQYAFGDASGESGQTFLLETGNRHHDVLFALGGLLVSGGLIPAEISADASAGEIINASANITATALTNAESITVIPDENWAPVLNDGDFENNEDYRIPRDQAGRYPVRSDEKLVADITQFGYSNNTASAYLGSQVVNNYTNLRQLPAVGEDVVGTVAVTNVTASAIGNAANIKVGFGLGD